MQWDDLRVFLAVARDESLSGAGRRLRIDPATVGRRIARLEEQIGTTLFAKSPQGYALTDAGERLLDHALRAEQAVLEPSDVTLDSTLEDLGIDSLGLVESIFAIEEEFDISIPFNANEPQFSDFDISNVRTIVKGIEGLMAEKA